MTLNEKIAVLDRLIEEFRWARPKPETEEYRTYEVLKSIAKDLRGRMNGAPSVAEIELGRRVNAAVAAKERNDSNLTGRLAHLGQEIIARWPTIQAALARFDSTLEEQQ